LLVLSVACLFLLFLLSFQNNLQTNCPASIIISLPQKLKCSCGRPSGKKARRIARKNKQLQKKIAELFEHRHLFVKYLLPATEKKILQRITRGLPQLRVLRTIMNEVYRPFDRRCCMDTALDKLKRLRRRIKRFLSLGETLKKLFSPNLEKSLIFLDDSLLPDTA